MFRLLIAIWFGKVVYFLTRILNTGGGSAAPGHYSLRIEPQLVQKLVSQIPQNIVITGTNGKTTTSRLLNHLVQTQKIKTLRNSTGSNLERGIASSLIAKVNWLGKIQDVDIGIWELDEAAFNKSVFQIKPQIIVFLNAFRDQLDRYGEVDSVVRKWMETLEKIDWNPVVLINGNDENVLSLNSWSEKETEGKSDKVGKYQVFKVKGDYHFGEKNLKLEYHLVRADFEASDIKTMGLDGIEFKITMNHKPLTINLPIPGIYHVFDFLAAFAAYYNLNLPVERINESLKNYSPAFGRVEKVQIGSNEAYIFLIKNPAGATLVFETIQPEIGAKDRILVALNDNFADGKDVSWIWDAEFSKINRVSKISGSVRTVIPAKAGIYTNNSVSGSRISSLESPQDSLQSGMTEIVCSGTRAEDLAV